MNYKLISFFLLFCVGSLSVQAKMYKWEDEDGNVHFGDKIPNQYLNKQHNQLNAQGAVVSTHDDVKDKTEEEKQETYRLKQIEREKKKKIKEQLRQDRMLLDTYTTERDLTAARDSRLDAVESQLQLSKFTIIDAKLKLDITVNQIATIKAAGNEVPKNITHKMKLEEKLLKTYQNLVTGHEKKKLEINEQFDGYIKRFRELKIDRQTVKDETEKDKQEGSLLTQTEQGKQKKDEEQLRQDRMLLDTYTTERDLTAARDARLDAAEAQLQLSISIVSDAKRKLAISEEQITTIKAAGNEVPNNITAKMKLEEDQVKTYQDLVAGHKKNKLAINEQFEGYIKRFRELKIDQQRVKDEREARRREAL